MKQEKPLRAVRACNSYDLQLYQFAQLLFEKRLMEMKKMVGIAEFDQLLQQMKNKILKWR